MTDHKFTVEEPNRVICFSLTSAEALEARDWLRAARAALKDVKPLPIPAIILELAGGFSAIAENRPYGGH